MIVKLTHIGTSRAQRGTMPVRARAARDRGVVMCAMEEIGRVLGLRRCPQTEKFAAD
jgi:hypothetical protein